MYRYQIIPCESFPNSVHSRLEYYSTNLNSSKSNRSTLNENQQYKKSSIPTNHASIMERATNLNSSRSN